MPSLQMMVHFVRSLFTDDEPERGDVPGWVLITLMTAALVAVIWAVAQESLVNLFQQAMQRFVGR